MTTSGTEGEVIATGVNVILRDATAADRGAYADWWIADSDWQRWDAPWEPRPEQRQQVQQQFDERFLGRQSAPRERALIANKQGRPIGYVELITRFGTGTTDRVTSLCHVGFLEGTETADGMMFTVPRSRADRQPVRAALPAPSLIDTVEIRQMEVA